MNSLSVSREISRKFVVWAGTWQCGRRRRFPETESREDESKTWRETGQQEISRDRDLSDLDADK